MTVKKTSTPRKKKEAPAPEVIQQQPESFSLFTEFDIYLFKSGTHYKLYDKLGAHCVTYKDTAGVYFAVWAPNAREVSVIGNFNGWNRDSHKLSARWDGSGIWEVFVPHIGKGETYKYYIKSNVHGQEFEKADPFALRSEVPPRTASIVWDVDYTWSDKDWMKKRGAHNALQAPYSVYEIHYGSWMRKGFDGKDYLDYYEMADKMVPYVKEMGFTHVEFMPLMGFPYDGSWGYQIVSYYACAAFFGDPQGLMHLIDAFHKEGIGVILDWVPSHFPGDAHGLINFDGTALYEHEDPRKGFHPDWKSYIFNYDRNEVRAFLISNALFWLDKYHIDGLRVDAVASMLYLDYSRNHGEWVPNEYGGNENLGAISFLREFNATVYKEYPDVQTIAEESTAFTGVSRPTYTGGLGFGMKWMMGWMHDTLKYFAVDPLFRKFHHNQITFSLIYAFTENFMLPLSHDEVVYGKQPLIYKMPGDEWQRFANLRTLYTYMFTHPGAKLLFMGDEFAQTSEWNYLNNLDWHLLQHAPHHGMQQLIKDLNKLYTSEAAIYAKQFEPIGFEWLDANDWEQSVLSYLRTDGNDVIMTVLNLTPIPRLHYRIGVPKAGSWELLLNSDDTKYWGSNYLEVEQIQNAKNENGTTVLDADVHEHHGKAHSIEVNLPPLSALVLKWKNDEKAKPAKKAAKKAAKKKKAS